ncbi:hypothetical protein [Marseilla massiliensis]|uniref:hypothetical protein n=1 Tax=Marseilla massiliensis TaxID=1841864 RepID=UPI0030C83D45
MEVKELIFSDIRNNDIILGMHILHVQYRNISGKDVEQITTSLGKRYMPRT